MFLKRSVAFILALTTTLSMSVNAFADIKLNAPTLRGEYNSNYRYVSLDWDYNDNYSNGVDVYRSSDMVSFDFIGSSMDKTFEDYDSLTFGKTYYYKVKSFYTPEVYTPASIFSDFSNTVPITVTLDAPTVTSISQSGNKALTIKWNMTNEVTYTGFNIYRSTSQNGTYTLVNSVSSTTTSFKDSKLKIGTKYFYKVVAVNTEQNITYEGKASNIVNAVATISSATINKAVSPKKKQNKISWKSIKDADGYKVYYSTKSNGKYKLLKTLNKNTTTYTHKKVKNGKAYFYKVYTFKNIGGTALLGTPAKYYQKYCNYYSFKNEPYEEKYMRLFGSLKSSRYKSAKVAKKHMTTITIKVWDIGAKKKKYKRKFYMQVNKALAPSMKKMFKEILKTKERFPINSIGCYNWRANKVSEHCFGCAIDINPTENYMIDGKTIIAGSFWKPKKSKYSIPLKCKLVTILEKYGFTRGFWGDRKDYMHFSYFGT